MKLQIYNSNFYSGYSIQNYQEMNAWSSKHSTIFAVMKKCIGEDAFAEKGRDNSIIKLISAKRKFTNNSDEVY